IQTQLTQGKAPLAHGYVVRVTKEGELRDKTPGQGLSLLQKCTLDLGHRKGVQDVVCVKGVERSIIKYSEEYSLSNKEQLESKKKRQGKRKKRRRKGKRSMAVPPDSGIEAAT